MKKYLQSCGQGVEKSQRAMPYPLAISSRSVTTPKPSKLPVTGN